MKRKQRRRNARARNRKNRGKRTGSGQVAVVGSYDGSPVEACTCPICVDMHRRGIPIVNERGEPIDIGAVDMIEVRVRGTVSTWPELDTDWRVVEVPAGCVLMDMLEYLCGDIEMRIAFPPGGLTASVNGSPGEDRRVLMHGDSVVISGARDHTWSEMMSRILVPLE